MAIGENNKKFYYKDGFSFIKAKKVSLDSYCNSNDIFPDLIKIDVEGDEIEVLKNSKEVLKRKPSLFISIHPFVKGNENVEEEILSICKNYNYNIIHNKNDSIFAI